MKHSNSAKEVLTVAVVKIVVIGAFLIMLGSAVSHITSGVEQVNKALTVAVQQK